MHDLIPLTLLSAGQSGQVRKVVGDDATVHRLSELGMRDGTKIRVIQHGSPCIVRMPAGKLCFRDTDALNVLIKLDGV